MRRALLVLLILAAAGAAAWYFGFRSPPGAPPALAGQVSAEHTLMFSSVEKPDVLIGAVFDAMQRQPALAERLTEFSPATAATTLGFDPATTAGWQGAGIDPATGVAMVMDARMGQDPYAVLRIADEPKFLQWISGRIGATATIVEGQLRAGTQPPLSIARRGEFTLIAQGASATILNEIAQDAGPRLSAAPGFEASFVQTKPTGRLTGFVPLANLSKAGPFTSGDAARAIKFYAALFPALGGQMDAEAIRIRVATTEPGLGALRQLYSPRRGPPKFSKWLPGKGFALGRFSANLHEFFTGLQALLPPSVPAQMRAQLGFAKMGLAMVGLDWSLLTQAFTGHVAIAVNGIGGREPQFLVLFALGTPESADKIIASLQAKVPQLLGQMGGGQTSPIEEIAVGGAPGKRIKLRGVDVTVVRSDAMLLLASSPALAEQAIARASGAGELTGRAAELMDADVVMAIHARLADLMPGAPGSPMQTFAAAAPPIAASIRLDRHGAVLDAQTMGLVVAALGAGKVAVNARQDAAREQMRKMNDLNTERLRLHDQVQPK